MQQLRYQVYRNLHQNLWSIREKKTQKVTDHLVTVCLLDCKFKVGTKGRERVLREKRKNVHAYIEGRFKGTFEEIYLAEKIGEAYYNPYTTEYFMMDGKKNYKSRYGNIN